MAGENLLCSPREPRAGSLLTLEDRMGGEEGGLGGRGYICIITADLHCCMAEIA